MAGTPHFFAGKTPGSSTSQPAKGPQREVNRLNQKQTVGKFADGAARPDNGLHCLEFVSVEELPISGEPVKLRRLS